MSKIPPGYCQCGCGQKTTIAKQTTKKFGWVKGKPKRFVRYHGSRKPLEYRVENRGYKTSCWMAKRTIMRDGRRVGRHVYMWEIENGPIPDGLELDHLCRQGFGTRNPTEICIRPSHLEAVTHKENVTRGHSGKWKIRGKLSSSCNFAPRD